jgi:hypothetical protein
MQVSTTRTATHLLFATSVFAAGVAIHDARVGRALPRKPRVGGLAAARHGYPS